MSRRVYTGTVDWERARNYPSYVYRIPASSPVDYNYPDEGYPYWSKQYDITAPVAPGKADYKVVIDSSGDTGTADVAVILIATPHTQARGDKEVLTYTVEMSDQFSDQQIVDNSIHYVFD